MSSGRAPVVQTKLERPRIKAHILLRPALMKQLKQLEQKTLTLVHAGPGFGKSTAAAAYLEQTKMPCCWYTVTEQDQPFSRFLQYVVEAIRRIHPDFGAESFAEWLAQAQRVQEQEVYNICSQLINACLPYTQDWILVIDDYHLVQRCQEIETFLKWFILHLPEQVHLVLLSRTKPDWDLLLRLKVQGRYLEVKETDLLFSSSEIHILFADHYGYPVSAEEAQTIYQKTEGWIMAVQMVWQQLQEEGHLQRLLENSASTMEELFHYLAQDVLDKQTPEVRSFLLESSILGTFSSADCQAILQRDDVDEVLSTLHERHLFLFRLGNGTYRYHALFQQFLQQELNRQPSHAQELQRRAADYYVQQEQWMLALQHEQQTQNTDRLARLIQQQGKTIMEQGGMETLGRLLSQIEEPYKDRYLQLRLLEGDICRYRSRYEQAFSHYERALAQAKQKGDIIIQSQGMEGLARIYLDTIQPKPAQRLLTKAIQLLEASSEGYPERLAELYALMSENSINLGRAKEAEIWFAKSQQLNADQEEEDLEARLHLRTGRLSQTLKLLEQRKKAQVQSSKLPKAHRETDLLLSLVYAMLGEGEKAKRAAERGILQGVVNQSPFVEACGWIRMGHAVQISPKYEWKLADTCYQTALQLMDEINISRGKAESYMGLSLLYGKKKNVDLAVQYAKAGLVETEKVNDRWLSTLLRVCQALAYVHKQEYEQALSLLTTCQYAFQACGDSYGLAIVSLWLAYATFQLNEEEPFYRHVNQLLRLVEKEGYAHLFDQPTLFGPGDVQKLSPMLLEAYHRRKGTHPYLDRLLLQMGMDGLAFHPGYTLRIQTFGEFKVFLGEQEVNDRDWKRGKAKELLQLFITKRKHLLPKEEIYALLWRDLPESVAARDFKVALTTLNNVLEPQRKARSTPFFIQRHASSYGLNLAAPFDLDSARFEHGIKRGLESVEPDEAKMYLQQALEMYTGDYLPERSHEDWCLEERERLQVYFLRGAEKLAHLYLEHEEYDACLQWAEKILTIDPCWEEAYRLLLLVYHRQMNRAMAIRTYQKCCAVLEKELGIEPMQATRELYQMMITERGSVYDKSGA